MGVSDRLAVTRVACWILIYATGAVLAANLALAADPERQAQVAARGAQVMPFRVGAATHVFTKTANGGVQRVVVKAADDTEQIRLIRTHLSDIARRFATGDFSAPTEIHGTQMPGLAELKRAKAGEITVRYQDLANGAQITYSAKKPDLVAALHAWLDAQLSDHGTDARAGHEHHHH